MIHLITVTEASRSFADIVGRVYYRGEEFDIKKGGQIVAHLGPAKKQSSLKVAELPAFLASCPSLSEGDPEAFLEDISEIRSLGGEIKDKWA